MFETGIDADSFKNSADAKLAGIENALFALSKIARPVLLMDEYCFTEVESAYAIGWNSVIRDAAFRTTAPPISTSNS